MADQKISQLSSGAPAQAGDEYVVARSGANYKLTLTNIAASMPPIGATTPNTGAFTTLSASGAASFTTLSASGAASFADGTSSAPAITNTGDTNTGVYFPAADEVAVAAGGSVAAAFNSNGVFFRNRIINGDMRIDQRNAGASVTPTADVYTLDRWGATLTQASKFSVQQSTTAPTDFVNSLLVTSASAYSVLTGDTFLLVQNIEGQNVADLNWGTANAKTVTLSFLVRSSLTGTFGGALTNSAANRSYPFSYTISSANTWTTISVTIPGDTTGTWLTTNGKGIVVRFGLGSGSTFSGTAGAWAASNFVQPTGTVSVVGTNGATFYITGVQLESGSVATPFERRPYGTEFFLCQRYYQEVGVAAENNFIYQAYAGAGSTYYVPLPLAVQMRAAPTATVAGTWGSGNVTGVFTVNASANSYRLNITATSAGNFSIQNNGAGSKLTFAIEL